MVGRGEIGEGTLYGSLACRGGSGYSQALQAEADTHSLPLNPSAKIAHGNSLSRHKSHPSTDPSHPPSFL